MSLGKSKSKSSTSPLYKGTQYSSVNNGIVNLDPSIRTLQGQGIGSMTNGTNSLSDVTGSVGADLGSLRSRLFTNMDPYTKAMVDPIKQQAAQATGSAELNLARRGLTGSSFRDQTLENVNSDYNRQISDASATAINNSINAGMTANQMMLQAAQLEAQGRQAEADYLRQIAADRANSEIGLLTATQSNSRGNQVGITLPSPSSPTGVSGSP